MRSLLALAAFGLAACQTVPSPTAPAQQSPGMVSAADPRAAEAGAQMLRQGGSATDAALATMLALTVVEPQSSGIGGGGFLVHREAAGGLTSYDGREEAPMVATPGMFAKDGQPMDFMDAVAGGRSVGVPGNVRLMALAHAAHGKLAWKALFAPAIALARDGFLITPRLYQALKPPSGAAFAGGKSLFYDAAGQPLPVGTRLRNPALAATLTALADRGPDAFYIGPIAQQVANTVATAPHNPTAMTVGDLASYRAVERAPLCGTYRGYRICGMGPPSSGATSVFAILKQVERFDLTALGPDSPTSWHLIAESMRLAFADRDTFIGDPDHVAVPSAGLMDGDYLVARGRQISATATLAKVLPGQPAGAPKMAMAPPQDEYGTSHFVATDAAGNVASYTSTIEGPFGSGLVSGGFFLNNELTDFNFVPDRDGVPTANRVEPGKRPRSSMSPTIVIAPDGSTRLAVGAAGGATIIAQTAKNIIGVLDWGLTAQQALDLPVLFAPGDTLWIEQGSALEKMVPALTALGHRDIRRRSGFKANAVEWNDGRWVGAADKRSEGAAVGQ